jgi:mannosyltransferase OCH1-like enzyme
MIPKIIHQIWVGDFKIPEREKKLMKHLRELHDDYEYMFWQECNDLPPNIQFWYDKFYSIKNYVFCADLLRMWVVYKHGGFYLDIDFDIKQKLNSFFEKNGAFFFHNDTDFTIPNNIFVAKKDSPILKYCIDNIKEECSWYGPSWFGKTIKEYLGFTNEVSQEIVKKSLSDMNIDYYVYWDFERIYGRHLSLYSWSPEIWNKLNNNEQL